MNTSSRVPTTVGFLRKLNPTIIFVIFTFAFMYSVAVFCVVRKLLRCALSDSHSGCPSTHHCNTIHGPRRSSRGLSTLCPASRTSVSCQSTQSWPYTATYIASTWTLEGESPAASLGLCPIMMGVITCASAIFE